MTDDFLKKGEELKRVENELKNSQGGAVDVNLEQFKKLVGDIEKAKETAGKDIKNEIEKMLEAKKEKLLTNASDAISEMERQRKKVINSYMNAGLPEEISRLVL